MVETVKTNFHRLLGNGALTTTTQGVTPIPADEPVPLQLQFDLSLVALLTLELQKHGIASIPWGQIALSFHGVPTVVNVR